MFLSGGREREQRAAPHPGLAQLRAYWEGLRAAGPLPARDQIDPRGIDQALEFAFIAERVAPGVACFRLAGMHLNDLMGMEVRGMPLTTFFAAAARDDAARAIDRAFLGRGAVELTLEGERGLGRPTLRAQMLLLPLRNESGRCLRLLGGLAAEGVIGRTPRRFTLAATTEAVLPARPTLVCESPTAAPLRHGRRGHLRLVHARD